MKNCKVILRLNQDYADMTNASMAIVEIATSSVKDAINAVKNGGVNPSDYYEKSFIVDAIAYDEKAYEGEFETVMGETLQAEKLPYKISKFIVSTHDGKLSGYNSEYADIVKEIFGDDFIEIEE